jgi:hypothetical protein
MRPTIPKAGKITLPGKMLTGLAKPPASLDLQVAYEIPNKQLDKDFHSIYRFFVDHALKPPERFGAVNWQDAPGPFDTNQSIKDDILSGLGLPQGTVFFVFSEKLPGGTPNVFDIRTQYRRLTVDPLSMTARFISQFPPSQKSKSIEMNMMKNAKALHNVIAAWDDKKQSISLLVDGKQIRK